MRFSRRLGKIGHSKKRKAYKTNEAPVFNEEASTTMPQGMSDRDFRLLGAFIQNRYGIKMPAHKKVMLQSRLLKRVRQLGMASFKEYCDYVLRGDGASVELVQMLDAVTTNKTDFFREPEHFDHLSRRILPDLAATHELSSRNKLLVWSAGCSTGEEPYTIAITLSEFATRNPGFDFLVLGTDLSSRVLDHAERGIYEASKVKPVPPSLKPKYFMKSKDARNKLFRIAPELRAKVKFRRLNLMDEDFGISRQVHIIFCRNVVIYFDRETQETLFRNFCRNLVPGGYLILGHSETLSGLDVPLTYVAPTIYKRER